MFQFVYALNFILFLILKIQFTIQHGRITGPYPPRNVQYNPGYCSQCANGAGVCGEGPGSQFGSYEILKLVDWNSDFKPVEIKLGSTIEFAILITAAHGGHCVFELCRPTGNTLTENCFSTRLLRDPSDERWSPFLETDPELFFFADNTCVANKDVRVKYIIPSDFGACDHCVIRWYWQTGNSCTSHPAQGSAQPAKFASWKSITGCKAYKNNLSPCGDNCPNMNCKYEQFKNCIDVKLVGGSSSATTTSKPTAANTTALKTTTQKTTKQNTTKQNTTKNTATKPSEVNTPPANSGSETTETSLNCDCSLKPGETLYNCLCRPKCPAKS